MDRKQLIAQNRAFVQAIANQGSHMSVRVGWLGKLNADGTLNPNVADGLDIGYVWIRFDSNGEPIRAVNMSVSGRLANTPVWVGQSKETKQWEVLRVADNAMQDMSEIAGTLNTPDRVSDLIQEVTDANWLKPLRCRPGTSSFDVYVEPGYYIHNGTWVAWEGGSINIASSVPTGNTKRPVLIGIDPSDNTLTTFDGDPLLITTPPLKRKMVTPLVIEATLNAAPTDIRWIACIPITAYETTWLDLFRVTALQFIGDASGRGGHILRDAGIDQNQRGAINFLSSPSLEFTLNDDPVNDETEVTGEVIFDGKILISAADTERDYLQDKLGSVSPELSVDVQTLGGGYQILNLELDQALIDHTNLLNRGTNTHATIDTHLASTSNPHNTTLEQARTANSTLSGKVIFAAPGTSDPSLRIPTGAAPSSPTAGDVWHDITQLTFMAYLAGIKQGLSGVIFTQTATVTVSNTGAETTLVGSGIGTMTLPANFLKVGKTLHIKAGGFYGTDASAPDNVVRIKLGSTTILATSADVLTAGIGNNRGWTLDAFITCRSVGATGTVIGQGMLMYSTGGVSTRNYPMQNLTTVTVDTTASLALNLTCDFNTADPDNIMNCTNLSVAVYN